MLENNGEVDAKGSPMSCLCKQKERMMQVLWIPTLFITLHCWLDKCNSRVDYCFQGSLLTVNFKKVSKLCSLKKDNAILSNCHIWLSEYLIILCNLKYQCCVLYLLLISPIRTSAASYSYIRYTVKICKSFIHSASSDLYKYYLLLSIFVWH